MTCQSLISDLSGVESSPAATIFVPPQDAQRQLRPRRVDGRTPRHLLCAPVYSAGSQLPLDLWVLVPRCACGSRIYKKSADLRVWGRWRLARTARRE